MAARKKKQKKQKRTKRFNIQFTLSLSGLFGLGVASFCIFLWMFLLGIWAGQTIFLPSTDAAPFKFGKSASSQTPQTASSKIKPSIEPEPAKFSKAEEGPPEPAGSQPDFAEPSYFCLQVGAFSESARAEKAVQTWRSRGYNAFMQSPEDADDSYWRVFVGKFENLADANALASRLEEKEHAKAFIALLPASKIRIP